MGASVFPMGVTKYDPEKAWSGYTPVSYTHLDVYKRQSVCF